MTFSAPEWFFMLPVDLEVVATLETTQGVVLDRDYKSVS